MITTEHHIVIEYCPKCKWLPRAAWMAQELLGTFEELDVDVTLVKALPGAFNIICDNREIYLKKKDGGFPEPMLIKQKIRDIIAPEMSLGHSDVKKQ